MNLVNEMRKMFLDEGKFGSNWLIGYNINYTMRTLQKKNTKFYFLGFITFDCELMYENIIEKFRDGIRLGKTQFAIV